MDWTVHERTVAGSVKSVCVNESVGFPRQCEPCALTCRQSLHMLQSSSCTTTSTLSINPLFRGLRADACFSPLSRSPREEPAQETISRGTGGVSMAHAEGAQVRQVCRRPLNRSYAIFSGWGSETSPLPGSSCVCACVCVERDALCREESAQLRLRLSLSLSSPFPKSSVSRLSSQQHLLQLDLYLPTCQQAAAKTPQITCQRRFWGLMSWAAQPAGVSRCSSVPRMLCKWLN